MTSRNIWRRLPMLPVGYVAGPVGTPPTVTTAHERLPASIDAMPGPTRSSELVPALVGGRSNAHCMLSPSVGHVPVAGCGSPTPSHLSPLGVGGDVKVTVMIQAIGPVGVGNVA